jgi:hypothetical protein
LSIVHIPGEDKLHLEYFAVLTLKNIDLPTGTSIIFNRLVSKNELNALFLLPVFLLFLPYKSKKCYGRN